MASFLASRRLAACLLLPLGRPIAGGSRVDKHTRLSQVEILVASSSRRIDTDELPFSPGNDYKATLGSTSRRVSPGGKRGASRA